MRGSRVAHSTNFMIAMDREFRTSRKDVASLQNKTSDGILRRYSAKPIGKTIASERQIYISYHLFGGLLYSLPESCVFITMYS
jgi:hypothetical protein